MMNLTPVFVSGGLPDLGIRVAFGGMEPRKPGNAFGTVLRCWNCGTQIGEKQGNHFYVNSNKVEIGAIEITDQVWRRCRGGKANPACRALNTMPDEWVKNKLPPLPTVIN